MVDSLRMLCQHLFFDEQPCSEADSEALDFRAASELFAAADRRLTRLRKLVEAGVLAEVGTGPEDPHRTYVVKDAHA